MSHVYDPSPISSCARATTAEELAYRIDYPLAAARNVRVVALDDAAEAIVRVTRDEGGWGQARFFVAADPGHEVQELDGGVMSVAELVHDTNSVVMVATAGENAEAVAMIGAGCQVHSVMTAGLVMTPGQIATEALLYLRPYARVLLVPAEPDDLPELLRAIRA